VGHGSKSHGCLALGGGNSRVFGLALSPCSDQYPLAWRDYANRRLVVSRRVVARRDQAAVTAMHETISVHTRGKGTYEITDEVARVVRESGIQTGTVTVFVRHTSASLVIYENADPSARADLHDYFEKIAPEDGDYFHRLEGPDDTTSHLRMALTRTSEVIPIVGGRMTLGTWQGIFVFEHRRAAHDRQVDVAVLGVLCLSGCFSKPLAVV
jgi:secondary thiamine-phosphate synthase enzyme